VNLEILDHFLTDPYEAMPYACRTWGKAIGAEVRAQGAIDDLVDLSSPVYNLSGESSGFGVQHSGQFNGAFSNFVRSTGEFSKRLILLRICEESRGSYCYTVSLLCSWLVVADTASSSSTDERT